MNLATGLAIGGRYEIVNQLGKGGFGTTFLAKDRHLPGDRFCVVKQLKPQAQDPQTLQAAKRLFETEAEVLYQLGTHPQIPRLFAYFTEDDEFYLVQEYIRGEPFSKQLVAGEKHDSMQVVSWIGEILKILQFVHQNQVIHRDINPHNLIIREADGQIFLIDFGAVKQISTSFVVASRMNLTVSIGTPGYQPSEQAHGNPKFSSDIYAVGIIAIQALTGLSPQEIPTDPDSEELMWRNYCTDINSRLADVLDRMVRYDFRQRFASATEVLQALESLDDSSLKTVIVSPKKSVNQPDFSFKLTQVFKLIIGISVLAGIGFGVSQIKDLQAASGLYQEGKTLTDLKKYPEALAAYEKAIALNPNYIEARIGKANILTQLNRYQEALVNYEKAIKLKPDSAALWQGRGIVLDLLNQNTQALYSFDRAIAIDRNISESWYGKGKILTKIKKYSEALKAYDEAVNLTDKVPKYWYERGWVLHNLKRYSEAITSYDKALGLQDSLAPAWYGKANSLVIIGRDIEAITAYQKAADYQPNYYQSWFSLGNILLKQQQYELAISAFDNGIKYHTKDDKIWANKGWALYQLKQYQLAVSAYDRSLALKRDRSQVWYNKGNALYNLNSYEAAAGSYRKATRYRPSYYQAWYSHGNALVKLKRYSEAVNSYEKALRYHTDYPEAIAALNWAKLQAKLSNLKNTVLPIKPPNKK
ncbi:serine/threonine-protein kinase [Merismopedia glauca]|uniref:Protein kinase n=1 Tax=Merismopedia glauca CCAP 1448/3 TaxID=1296344 RepID=A0A2T1BZL7_9CYAN|nr:serine/threonine-protein kinase [Merismopedia glauca]PSB01469.1 protein kinase [Merismopedia glauca CCAP 1448/3]